MKKFNVVVVLFVVGILICSSFGLIEKQKLSITVTNIKKEKGTVYISVFKEKYFLEKGKELIKKGYKVNSGTVKQLDLYLEPGTYAIAVYYDANNNNKCDLNFFGVPTEQYAFSNNFKPFMSSPKFSDCSFNLGNKEKTLKIKMLN